MAFPGLRRGDITIHGIGSEEGFAVRWHRLLFPTANMFGFHDGVLTLAPVTVAPDGHAEPQLLGALDETTSIPDEAAGAQDPVLVSPAPTSDFADAPYLILDAGPDPVWHPPYSLSVPISEESVLPTATPDHDPTDALLPKSDAVLWHGPALMIFPGEPQETAEGGAPPDTAGTPDAVTRADLDPLLTAMGSDHAAPSGGADLSAAFLPPDADDLPHGIDSGMLLTPPPLPPPPPEVI